MKESIRISRKLSLEIQVFTESIFDYSTKQGYYEKTLDPETREPVYIPLY